MCSNQKELICVKGSQLDFPFESPKPRQRLAYLKRRKRKLKLGSSLSQERMRPGLSIEIASWLSSCSLNTKGIFTRKVVAKREKSFVHSPKSTSFLSHVLDGQHAFVFF